MPPVRGSDAGCWLVGIGPRVVILMGCFNGAEFLREQLDSIQRQSHSNWVLVAADDGSTDSTRAILDEFRERMGAERVVVTTGPGRGVVANFLHLACFPPIYGDYYAFCDQDDVWEEEKLARALDILSCLDATQAVLYGSRTRLIDEVGRHVGCSPNFQRAPCFRNALVQNIAGGNTMVFNETARSLLVAAGPEAQVVAHDWWLYLLVSGSGGRVHFDAWSSVKYRQHEGNLIGGNLGWRARLSRLRALVRGRHRCWNTMHCEALARRPMLLSPENLEVFVLFQGARRESVGRRLIGIARSRVFRQTRVGTLSLYASVLLNRF